MGKLVALVLALSVRESKKSHGNLKKVLSNAAIKKYFVPNP